MLKVSTQSTMDSISRILFRKKNHLRPYISALTWQTNCFHQYAKFDLDNLANIIYIYVSNTFDWLVTNIRTMWNENRSTKIYFDSSELQSCYTFYAYWLQYRINHSWFMLFIWMLMAAQYTPPNKCGESEKYFFLICALQYT